MTSKEQPRVIVTNKELSFYQDMLTQFLFRTDREVLVHGLGVRTKSAVETVTRTASFFDNIKYGSVNFRYGRVLIEDKIMEDYNRVPEIIIPCRILEQKEEGYRKVKNLNSDPWGKYDYLVKDTSKSISNIFNLIAEEGKAKIIGHDDGIINALKIYCNIKRKMHLNPRRLDVELGYRSNGKIHSPGIRIDMDI